MHVGQVHNKTHTHTDLFCLEWRGYGRSVGSLELGTKTWWQPHQLRTRPAGERKEVNWKRKKGEREESNKGGMLDHGSSILLCQSVCVDVISELKSPVFLLLAALQFPGVREEGWGS